MSAIEEENKRKIIEIYVTDNDKENTISFEFIRTENSELANSTLKGLVMMFEYFTGPDIETEVEIEKKEGE